MIRLIIFLFPFLSFSWLKLARSKRQIVTISLCWVWRKLERGSERFPVKCTFRWNPWNKGNERKCRNQEMPLIESMRHLVFAPVNCKRVSRFLVWKKGKHSSKIWRFRSWTHARSVYVWTVKICKWWISDVFKVTWPTKL